MDTTARTTETNAPAPADPVWKMPRKPGPEAGALVGPWTLVEYDMAPAWLT